MISVLVVNRDGVPHLTRCLESVVTSGAEVMLVDNASSDGSVELVRDRFPEVTLLQQDRNIGFAAANNLAAATASGELFLLLNSDAWLEPGALDHLAAALERRPELGLVAPRLCYPDGSPQFSWSPARGIIGEVMQKVRNPFERRGWAHGAVARAVARLAGRPWYTAACVMVRAAAWESVGGFDECFFMYFEDVDLCIRLGRAGWRLAQEPRAVARHAGGAASIREIDDLYRPSQLRYYRIHRPVWESRLMERRLRRRFGNAAVDCWLAGRDRP